MQLIDIYNNNICSATIKVGHYKRLGNFIIGCKLILVGIALYCIYQWLFNQNSTLGFVALFSVFAFAIVYIFDYKYQQKRLLLELFIKANNNEINALNGDISCFNSGSEFVDANHNFSYDLDIFAKGGLYQYLSRTATLEGGQALAELMLKTDVAVDIVLKRQEAIAELKELSNWRLQFIALGLAEPLSLNMLEESYKQEHKIGIKNWQKWVGVILIFATTTTLLANILGLFTYHVWLAFFFTNLFIVSIYLKTTNKTHSKLNGAFSVVSKYNHLLKHIANEKDKLSSQLLSELVTVLTLSKHNSIKAFSDLEKLVSWFDQRSNVLISVALNGLFLSDLQLLLRYNKWIDNYGDKLLEFKNAISQIDALISLSNYAYNNPLYVMPKVNKDIVLQAKELGHPLIFTSERVCNDFEINKLQEMYITTGANMAGKSTFLRTVGVNLILASSGAPVCAKQFEFQPMLLFSSMRASDNLVSHVSYFQAELLRLQKLIEIARMNKPMFLILDEILKGTNSKDKLEGSRVFLLNLINNQIVGILATHDLALGELAIEYPHNFKNCCFEVEIKDDELYFSYKLQSGVAKNLNATWLLNKMLATKL